MKVLVCVKHVIDYRVKVRVKPDGVDLQNVQMGLNPFDEIALEEAVRWREAGVAAEVTVLSIGNDAVIDSLRKALAMGADQAVHVQADGDLEPLAVAKVIAEWVAQHQPGAVLLGKQAIDNDCNQVGQMLAGLLDWPQATFASKITLSAESAEVVREVDGGLETISCELPAVFTADLRLNEPRYPSLPNMMQAKRKPIDTVAIEDFSVDITPRLQLSGFKAPEQARNCQYLDSVDQLVSALTEEGVL